MQQREIVDTWMALWWEMASGIKSEYERLKATDVFEFWNLFDLWKERTRRETEMLKIRARGGRL